MTRCPKCGAPAYETTTGKIYHKATASTSCRFPRGGGR